MNCVHFYIYGAVFCHKLVKRTACRFLSLNPSSLYLEVSLRGTCDIILYIPSNLPCMCLHACNAVVWWVMGAWSWSLLWKSGDLMLPCIHAMQHVVDYPCSPVPVKFTCAMAQTACMYCINPVHQSSASIQCIMHGAGVELRGINYVW